MAACQRHRRPEHGQLPTPKALGARQVAHRPIGPDQAGRGRGRVASQPRQGNPDRSQATAPHQVVQLRQADCRVELHDAGAPQGGRPVASLVQEDHLLPDHARLDVEVPVR
eukprot:11273445-Heterocapsa_arctica.AAC.1